MSRIASAPGTDDWEGPRPPGRIPQAGANPPIPIKAPEEGQPQDWPKLAEKGSDAAQPKIKKYVESLEKEARIQDKVRKNLEKDLARSQAKLKRMPYGKRIKEFLRLDDLRQQIAESASQAQRLRTAAKAIKEAANVGGLFLGGYDQYSDSTAATEVGRRIDSALAMSLDAATSKYLPAKAVDAAVSGVIEALGYGKYDVTIAEQLGHSIRAAITLAEGVAVGETSGMHDFSKRAAEGKYGPLFEAANAIGQHVAQTQTAQATTDYWAQHGFIGGIKQPAQALMSLVP